MTDIVGFMPTPFTETDTVDAPRLSNLAASIAEAGIHPAVLGGMGEFYALSIQEARACMDAAVEGAAGRTPVVAGIGHDTGTAVRLARHAADAGIGLIVANPLYYVSPSNGGYADHIRAISSESGLPVIIYSAPSYPATDELIESLLEIDGFAGVKEEYYDVPSTAGRIRKWGDRLLWWGVGEQVGCDFASVGATTVTTSLANVNPQAASDYIHARVAGMTPAPDLVELVTSWEKGLSADREGAPAFLKEAMHQHAGWLRSVRLPLRPSHRETQDAVTRVLSVSRRRVNQEQAIA